MRRMGHHVGDSEGLGTMQFLDKGLDRLPPQPPIGTGQIDQVRIVGDGVGYAQSVQCPAEPAGLFRRNVLGGPLVVVFRKQLDAVAAAPVGALYRLVVAAGDRLVGAKNGHPARIAEGWGNGEVGLQFFAIGV